MAEMDDHWVRLFNVSDPRRAFAGHTLYKVTSKVFQKEFPEGATEIAVWRRFSDFKKLHQELSKIYVQKHAKDEEFPAFPKAKFFGRFEEPVIEERRKAALELLTFAGSIPDLFTSQPFVKFFEGGFPDSPIHSDGVRSREGSSSDTEGEIFRGISTIKELDTSSGSTIQNDGQSTSLSCTASRENGDKVEDSSSLGGVWLYKQPSLSEGLDNLSSDEDENDECETVPPAGCESGETDLTRLSNGEAAENNEDEHDDDVFTQDPEERLDNEQDIPEKEDRSSSAEPPNWLVRAISICSEGEDLEVLASEADAEELCFPQAFSEYDASKQEEDESSPFSCSDSLDDLSLQQNRVDTFEASAESSSSIGYGHDENQWTEKSIENMPESKHYIEKTESAESSSLKDSSSVGTTEDIQSFTSSSDSGKEVTRQRTVSDLANIYIDPKESDYLYAAGHTIHKALDCEVNGKYGEAFSLYKTCVGLLLSGVQGEKDVKRREAVRRKTAQYLLKAEALYNTYLVSESPEKSEQDSSPPHSDLCKSDDLQKFKELTLADLKVMGIVGKVILVENIHNGETFVIKALCKSGPTRTQQNSQGSERRRKKSVRRLYGKYPNIVRLYKYFETATAIYLLLEYARGGRLWDHISCYQRNKESHDYLIRNTNRKNTELKNSASDPSVTRTKAVDTTDDRPTPQVAAIPLEGENVPSNLVLASRTNNSATVQVSELDANVSAAAAAESENHTDGITTPFNGNDKKLSEVNREVHKVNKDCTNNCNRKAGDVTPNNKSSLFVKLDEYFSTAAQCVPHEHIRVWAAELVLAVAYLHTSGIICRDLHPKNVLLDEEGHVLLTYFGSWEETEHIPDEEAMSHFYCAPEMWQVDEVTTAADWWSVGALLYEIITGQALSMAHPWGVKTHTELHLPNKISPESKSLLRELLRVAPSERLGSGVNGVEEIKSHPYFSGVNWTWLCSRIN